MSERALLLLRDSCSGEDEGVTAFLIRDTVAGDVDALRDVFRRSSLSNDGDREEPARHPRCSGTL